MLASWNLTCQKYGWDNIKHEILFDNLTQEEAAQKEIELIQKFNSTDRRFGYNIETGGCIHYHTDETRKKMSESRKGKAHSKAHNKAVSISRQGIKFTKEHVENIRKSHIGYEMPQSQRDKISKSCKGKGTKAVVMISLDGEELETFESVEKAAKAVGLKSPSNISSCCKGKKKKIGGYKWKYA